MRLDQENIHVLILSAGKIVKDLEGVFGNIPSGLIPINGKPIIFRIIDKLLEEGFQKISITVGYEKNSLIKLINEYFNKKIKINFIDSDFTKPPGNSILNSLDHIQENKLLVILGDTLVDENFDELIRTNGDFVLTSQNFVEPKKWCVIKKENQLVTDIFDKKDSLLKNNDLHALIGVYYFDDLTEIKKLNNLDYNVEISKLIERHKIKNPVKAIECKSWYDVGHIENYYVSKRLLLQARFFNYLKFDDVLGVVTKTSDDVQKLKNEIEWYQKIPTELSVLTPRVIEYQISEHPFIKLEYIGYPTLAELWLYSDIHSEIWKNILNRLLKIVSFFKKYQGKITKEDYRSVYVEKTEKRVQTLLKNNDKFKKKFDKDVIIINEKKYKNWNSIKEKIYSKIDSIWKLEDGCFIHGDLCFSNILFDVNNGIFKIVDPRGKWNSTTFGDLKYDIAKLRHSIVGNYDSILNGLYSVSYNNDKITLDIFQPKIYDEISTYFDKLISKNWELKTIKLIEGVLFISMLPLHNDSFERQLALYSVGIQRLNEVID